MYTAHLVKEDARKRQSRRGWRHTSSEVLVDDLEEEGAQYMCKFFEGLLRHAVLTH